MNLLTHRNIEITTADIVISASKLVLHLSRLLLQLQLSFYRGVKVILNVVIRSPWQKLRYLSPFVSIVPMSLHNQLIFFFSPFPSLYVGVQMVMPSFSA